MGNASVRDAHCGDIMRGVVVGLVSIIILCGVVLYSVKAPGITPLNFIETFFGLSPDGHDCSLEILLLVALAMVVAAVGLSLRSTVRQRSGSKSWTQIFAAL